MRILFCTNSLGAFGGIERATIVKANALSEIVGNTVAIAYTDKGTFPDQVIYPLSPHVHTYDLGVPFWDLTPIDLKTLLTKAPAKFVRLRRAIRKLIREFDPDIIVTTGSYEKYVLASIPLSRHRAKIREYHFNSHYRTFQSASVLGRIAGCVDNNLLGRFFDMNFLLTREDAERFSRRRNFTYQHNPCSFDGAPVDDPDGREDTVVVLGRLVDVKNVADILRAWSMIMPQVDGWQLQIIGEGDQKDTLEDLARDLGIASTVQFLGYRADVASLLRRAKVLAMSSKYEGMPLNILEGMHYGVVPVTYATPNGPRDIITDGINGILTPYMDVEALARGLLQLIKDPERLRAMSKAACHRSLDFVPEVIAQQWMEHYRRLTSHR